MKNVLSPRLIHFANRVARIPFAKLLLKPFYYPYKRFLEDKRRRAFHACGLHLLSDFDQVFSERKLPYTLAFGTLLGAIREHGFISHDCDIDVFVWNEDYSPEIKGALENKGFTLEHAFLVDGGRLGREETYSKYDVSVDIFYVYPPIDEYQYTCDFIPYSDEVSWAHSQKKYGRVLARRIEIPVSKQSMQVSFGSLLLPVPDNYDEFLRFRYGDDYMIPNPSWSNGENPHIVVWNDAIATYSE